MIILRKNKELPISGQGSAEKFGVFDIGENFSFNITLYNALKQKNVTLRRYERQNALVITNSQYRLLRVTSVDFFADLR